MYTYIDMINAVQSALEENDFGQATDDDDDDLCDDDSLEGGASSSAASSGSGSGGDEVSSESSTLKWIESQINRMENDIQAK